jgi:hypothetical protein
VYQEKRRIKSEKSVTFGPGGYRKVIIEILVKAKAETRFQRNQLSLKDKLERVTTLKDDIAYLYNYMRDVMLAGYDMINDQGSERNLMAI